MFEGKTDRSTHEPDLKIEIDPSTVDEIDE
jgi:hypothetical protein